MNTPEKLSLAGFILEVGGRARGRAGIATEIELRDPLKAILDRIWHSPATVEHKLLLRVLYALTKPTADEDFSRAEVAALSLSVLQLLYATVQDVTSGRYHRADIEAAVLIHTMGRRGDVGTKVKGSGRSIPFVFSSVVLPRLRSS